MTHATVRGIELDYESFGAAGAPAILLVMGLGMPGIAWPDPLVDGLVAAGFRVVRFDNRDCGHSSKIAGGRLPDLRMAIARALLRRTVRAPYTLDDMAADTVGLLDALGIERAHLIGASMGGMIAQNAAALFPQRVASLTSIMASTGNPSLHVSVGKPRALRVLLARPARSGDPEALVEHYVRVFGVIGSPGFAVDDELLRQNAGGSWVAASTPRALRANCWRYSRPGIAARCCSASRRRRLSSTAATIRWFRSPPGATRR